MKTRLTPLESRIVDWLAARRESMLSLLADLVGIDSGTANVVGVAAMAERVELFLSSAGLAPSAVARPPYGRGVRVELPGERPELRSVLLMGHLDTVFPVGEAARRPFGVSSGRATGPGVADMKAGLVMNSFVLAAFKACGGHRRTLVGLYTGDEEVGSPAYRGLIEEEAARAAYAFNAEPGRVSGNLVIQRRGGVFMRLVVAGKAAHAGVDFRAGVSAIHEMAEKIIALSALTDFERGITVNVGTVSGGQSVNTTAPSAEALIDLRYVDSVDRAQLMAAITSIVDRGWIAGSSARLEIIGEFLPLVATPSANALFDRYRVAADDLGFDVGVESTGGCADSGFAAAAGAVTLCALGPVGGNAHSPSEYVDVDTIVPRAQALALTILRLDADFDTTDVSDTQRISSSLRGEEQARKSRGIRATQPRDFSR